MRLEAIAALIEQGVAADYGPVRIAQELDTLLRKGLYVATVKNEGDTVGVFLVWAEKNPSRRAAWMAIYGDEVNDEGDRLTYENSGDTVYIDAVCGMWEVNGGQRREAARAVQGAGRRGGPPGLPGAPGDAV